MANAPPSVFPADFPRGSQIQGDRIFAAFKIDSELFEALGKGFDLSTRGLGLGGVLGGLCGAILLKFSSRESMEFAIVGMAAPNERTIVTSLKFTPEKTFFAFARDLALTATSGFPPSDLIAQDILPPSCRAAFELSTAAAGVPFDSEGAIDLMLHAVPGERSVSLNWTAPQGLFRKETLQMLAEIFLRLAQTVASSPNVKLSDLPVLEPRVRQTVLFDWNATGRAFPAKSIAELFKEQANLRPEAPAIHAGECITYFQLHERTNRLARLLLRSGVGPGTCCSVCLERSVEAVICILAILKTGAAYVPLDPGQPPDRIAYMNTTSQVTAMITRESWGVLIKGCPGKLLFWENLEKDAEREVALDLEIKSGPEDLAYICFTSGSTGKPKGVAVTQRGCVRLVCNTDYAFLGPEEVFLLHSPLSFDASTFELWAPLLNGGMLEILPPGPLDLRLLGKTIVERQISTLWLTAALFHAMVDARLEDLREVRQLLVGGDVVSVDHARRFRVAHPQCRLINGYGPTENTTFSTCHTIEDEDLRRTSLPIGKPIANSRAYILDTQGQPLPPLFTGELFVGGDGVAQGYVNDPDLTAERFVSIQIGDQKMRLYRTGDRARWLLDGTIEFLGRFDHQVKIDGYRIELGEIESALLSLSGVQKAAVVVFDVGASKRLAAFIVGNIEVSEIQREIRPKLPEYMVPTTIRILPSLPLNLHGKIDRFSLRALLTEPMARMPIAPQNPIEERLHAIWSRCLGHDGFGIHDDFFAVGGSSLRAARLFAEISREFGRDLPLATLVEARTIALLAPALATVDSGSRIIVAPFAAVPTSNPWFIVPGAGSDPIVFRDLAQALSSTNAVIGLQARGLDNSAYGSWDSVVQIAQAMVTEIVTRQTEGPYFIGGHCFGAVLAWEIAQQLQSRGCKVEVLALFDPIVSDVFSNDVFGGARWPYHWKRLQMAPWRLKPAFVKTRCLNFLRTLWVRRSVRPAQDRAKEIHATYTFLRYEGKVCVVLAENSFYNMDPERDPRRFYQRRAHGQNVQVLSVPGDHHTMLHEEGAGTLALALEAMRGFPVKAV